MVSSADARGAADRVRAPGLRHECRGEGPDDGPDSIYDLVETLKGTRSSTKSPTTHTLVIRPRRRGQHQGLGLSSKGPAPWRAEVISVIRSPGDNRCHSIT